MRKNKSGYPLNEQLNEMFNSDKDVFENYFVYEKDFVVTWFWNGMRPDNPKFLKYYDEGDAKFSLFKIKDDYIHFWNGGWFGNASYEQYTRWNLIPSKKRARQIANAILINSPEPDVIGKYNELAIGNKYWTGTETSEAIFYTLV